MNKKVLLFASAIMLNIGVVLASDVGEGIPDDIRALLSPNGSFARAQEKLQPLNDTLTQIEELAHGSGNDQLIQAVDNFKRLGIECINEEDLTEFSPDAKREFENFSVIYLTSGKVSSLAMTFNATILITLLRNALMQKYDHSNNIIAHKTKSNFSI